MVIQAKSIKGSLAALRYQADDKSNAVEISRNELLVSDDPKVWHEQMTDLETAHTRSRNKRFSVVLAPSKEVSHKLTNDDWVKLVDNYLQKMGIDKNNHYYIAHLHNSTDDKHVHLTISRCNFNNQHLNGTALINDNQIGIRSGKIADAIAAENGWRTAKDISHDKRMSIAASMRTALKTAQNYHQLIQMMHDAGFTVRLSQSEAKGVYGMRIIPNIDINTNPNSKASPSQQGYKLSEIPRQEGRKATFRINDITMAFERNTLQTLSGEDKIDFLNSRKEKVFGTATGTTTSANGPNTNTNKRNILDIIEQELKPTYVSPDDDISKRKKKRKR